MVHKQGLRAFIPRALLIYRQSPEIDREQGTMIANLETGPPSKSDAGRKDGTEKLIHVVAPSSLDSRFFSDNGDWKTAPLLKGQTSFATLPTVKSILVTGGAGFM